MPLKIIFMGTPKFAIPIIKSINDSKHVITQVYTQPPKKKNRGQKVNFDSVYNFSHQNNIKVRFPDKFDENEISFLKSLKADIVVVVAYGKILPTKLLNINGLKFINIHASILPKWRGAAPIQRAIMNLDKETGISIMKIIPELDAGPVMLISKVKILKETNFEMLSEKLSNLGAKMILKCLDLLENKKENFIEQNSNIATYANKISKAESKIDWFNNADKIIAKVNAFYPNPGCWFNYKGSRLKVLKAAEIKANGKPGEIIKDNFTIACLHNSIQILEIQKEGKNKMSVDDFLKGNKLEVGVNVSEQI